MDEHSYRLAELRLVLAVLTALGQATKPGSPERWAVLADLEPLLSALCPLRGA